MILSQLHIHHLRNLVAVRTALHPHLNLIIGANGSGKTSFLEAIYLLGCGHSFRTREATSLVAYEQEQLTIFAKTSDEQAISICKSATAPTQVRINSRPCLSSSELAAFLPTQIFYADIFTIIDEGPATRRSLLDWGLFHVKPYYHAVWKDYRRALKQRNALLKQNAKQGLLHPWDTLLSDLGEQLHALRSEYVSILAEQFNQLLPQFTEVSCQLQYFKGWDKRNDGKSLLQVLQESYESDSRQQYTHYGAHQADLLFNIANHKAKHHLSRGQQKMILFALKFAQALLLSKPCVFLIDDICAELDAHHLHNLVRFISNSEGQFFITADTIRGELQNFTPLPHQVHALAECVHQG